MPTRLYGREELLSLYGQCIREKEEELVRVIRYLPFTPFIGKEVISQEQEEEWKRKFPAKDDVARQLIRSVQERNTLELYLMFSRCVQYLSSPKTKEIFTFIPDLIQVGLHDPLPTKSK